MSTIVFSPAGSGKPRVIFRLWLMAAMMIIAMDAIAMRRVDPGKAVELSPDEGLVLFVVDTNTKISNVQVNRVNGGTAVVLNYQDTGRNLALYVGKAGEYVWSEVNLTTVDMRSRFRIAKPEFRFSVVPGKLTYPGDLVVRPDSLTRSYIQVHNRALAAMDWVETTHSQSIRALPFVYAGYYPDPFIAHYLQARKKDSRSIDDLSRVRSVVRPKALTDAANEMWQGDRLLAVALSPGGKLLAQSLRGRGTDQGIELVDLASGRRDRIAGFVGRYLIWKDDRTLIASQGDGQFTVLLLSDKGDGTFKADVLPILGRGRVLDLLPAEPGRLLFEGQDSRGKLVVHRIELRGDKAIRGFQNASTSQRLNKAVTNEIGWLTDGEGRLRAAVAFRDPDFVLLHERDGEFEEVLSFGDDVEPLGLSRDGGTVYALSESGRAHRELVAYHIADRKFSTVFAKQGIDLTNVVFGFDRTPVAVNYYQSGRLTTEYIDDGGRELTQWLQSAFPGRSVGIIDRSVDGRNLLAVVDGGDMPPRIYHVDSVTKRSTLIDEVVPGLAGRAFAPANVLRVKGSDGLDVEAFLTLPPGTGKRPMVVFPHGGPIGVSDSLHFDREVQFIASLGYAVLQVNFRGSSGYGKAFRDAGAGNYGRLIEDDIDAAIKAAIAEHPVDESRMCMIGASYGGYSALISAIRWPNRFRCVVSLYGVTDRVLFFTASDAANDSSRRRIMEEVMGNPLKDLESMTQTSPLYQTGKLTAPTMLVHAREDKRVDFEHTRRLVRMLGIDGRMPVVLTPPGKGHALDDPFHLVVAWSAIGHFLGQHLDSQSAGASASDSTFILRP